VPSEDIARVSSSCITWSRIESGASDFGAGADSALAVEDVSAFRRAEVGERNPGLARVAASPNSKTLFNVQARLSRAAGVALAQGLSLSRTRPICDDELPGAAMGGFAPVGPGHAHLSEQNRADSVQVWSLRSQSSQKVR
jgi:hypothetical protein